MTGPATFRTGVSATVTPRVGTVPAVGREGGEDEAMAGGGSSSTSTLPREQGSGPARRSLRLRRLFLAAVVAFLVLGALDVFGVRSGEVSAVGGGYELSVRYPAVARPGLAVPFSIEVRRPGGFDGPVRVAVTERYLELFDENGLSPDPASATSDGEHVIWEFETPSSSDTLSISFDVRVEPAAQLTAPRATTSLLEEEAPVVSVRHRTWVMP